MFCGFPRLMVFLALLLTPAAGVEPPARRPPNILFIMADDLGPEWIGCCGGEGVKTPRIDALARGGMRFVNVWSMPKCTPTRVTLLTGQYPFRHGWVNHWDVPRWGGGCHFDPQRNASFARLLRSAGYATAIAGKWQIDDFRLTPSILARHGFDEWCVWTGYEKGNPPSAERYWDPYVHTRSGSRTRAGAFGPDVFTDFLIDFMRRHSERPMMLYYPMVLPHGPLVATPREPGAQGTVARFSAMVRAVDHEVGRLVAALEELGLSRDTIVIFTADNGTSRGITGRLRGRQVRGGKGTLSESGCHEPFIAWGPGRVPAGVVSDALIDFTDLLPTFVELAGAELPAGEVFDGRSFAPLLLGRTSRAPRTWILSMGGGVAKLSGGRVIPARPYADRVVRDWRFKLWVIDGKPARLFDLIADPGEEHDLFASTDLDAAAARARLAAVVASLPAEDARPRYEPNSKQGSRKRSNPE